MKAISIRQPWASFIASGRKKGEIRSWLTHHRGDLVVCAGLRIDESSFTTKGPLLTGVTLCVVNLVDCHSWQPRDARSTMGDDCDGMYVFELRDVRPLAPIPVKGQLGLFSLSPTVVRTLGLG